MRHALGVRAACPGMMSLLDGPAGESLRHGTRRVDRPDQEAGFVDRGSLCARCLSARRTTQVRDAAPKFCTAIQTALKRGLGMVEPLRDILQGYTSLCLPQGDIHTSVKTLITDVAQYSGLTTDSSKSFRPFRTKADTSMGTTYHCPNCHSRVNGTLDSGVFVCPKCGKSVRHTLGSFAQNWAALSFLLAFPVAFIIAGTIYYRKAKNYYDLDAFGATFFAALITSMIAYGLGYVYGLGRGAGRDDVGKD